eukprot:1187329-Prorocentrum_minimum.AAC.3
MSRLLVLPACCVLRECHDRWCCQCAACYTNVTPAGAASVLRVTPMSRPLMLPACCVLRECHARWCCQRAACYVNVTPAGAASVLRVMSHLRVVGAKRVTQTSHIRAVGAGHVTLMSHLRVGVACHSEGRVPAGVLAIHASAAP